MASILKVDEMQGVTSADQITVTVGSTSMTLHNGIAKFHCSYESGGSTGGAGALQSGSLNISSVSDNGTGNFSPNFSSNFSGATYTVLGNFQIAQDSGAMRNAMSRSRATSNTKFLNYDQNGNLTESVMDYNMLSGFGDLA
jgi:hypothetical protein